MPKIRRDNLDDYQPYKEKVPRRKAERWEEFDRDASKRNKRNKLYLLQWIGFMVWPGPTWRIPGQKRNKRNKPQ